MSPAPPVPAVAPSGTAPTAPGRVQPALRAVVRTPEGAIGAFLLAIVLLWILIGPLFAPYSPTEFNVGLPGCAPSGEHLLGCDGNGRDVLSRVLAGGGSTLLIPTAAVLISSLIGGTLGLVAAYFGGRVDTVIGRLLDALLTLPSLLVILVVVAGLGASTMTLIITVGMVFAAGFGRVVRATAHSVTVNAYVEAAQARGERAISVMLREVVPNIAGPVLAEFGLQLTYGILFVSAISYLGLGVQPPNPDWGLMVSENAGLLSSQPLAAVAPAIGITCLCVSFNLLADALSDHLSHDEVSRMIDLSGERSQSTSEAHRVDRTASLSVRGLGVTFSGADGSNRVVSGLDLDLQAGTVVGLAGESGCGKSTAALAAMGYGAPGAVLEGSSALGGVELVGARRAELRRIWGRQISYVSQDARAAVNPALRIGVQLEQVLSRHLGLRGEQLRNRQLEVLEAVAIDDPNAVLSRYPHQFSGGQLQRIALGIAIACRPDVLILDEPTTGLDVTTQARIAALIRGLVEESGMAALFVSHDLALLGSVTDRVAVMYAGEIVEIADTETIRRPAHPYTAALLDSVPDPRAARHLTGLPGEPPTGVVPDACAFAARCPKVIAECTQSHVDLVELNAGHGARCIRASELVRGSRPTIEVLPVGRTPVSDASALLSLAHVSAVHKTRRQIVEAVTDVSFSVAPGETLGVVGESGSGKSTLLRTIAGLHAPSAGSLRFLGEQLAPAAVKRPVGVRRAVQIVFQDPGSSLNPRQNVLQLIGRPLRLFKPELDPGRMRENVLALLDSVKLPRALLQRYPWELSGGEQQRVAIARAFAPDPELLLCDEITSALDVSVQATIIELFAELVANQGTSAIFVSHDLGVVRTVASRAVVMNHGRVCEQGAIDDLFDHPREEYTKELMDSIPKPFALAGIAPSEGVSQ